MNTLPLLPPELAALAAVPLNPHRPILVGNDAALLRAARQRSQLLRGDFPALFPLLHAVQWTADCLLLHASPTATPAEVGGQLTVALACLERQGEGVIVAGLTHPNFGIPTPSPRPSGERAGVKGFEPK